MARDNPNLQIGDLVLVKEDKPLPHHWPAVVIETHLMKEVNTTPLKRPPAVTTNIHSLQRASNPWSHKEDTKGTSTDPTIQKFNSHRM
jgi:hypothetical protein